MMDDSNVQIAITSIQPGATVESVQWYGSTHAPRPSIVTVIVALDYLKKYGVMGISSGDARFTLIEKKVVLVKDELKLQLTFQEESP